METIKQKHVGKNLLKFLDWLFEKAEKIPIKHEKTLT